ncbi:protein phosphatase 1 regulatory subunit 12B-like isoform X1 [Drosophila sechellia]|uniref:protein phosphatase 1 regulatory subunit 12B-like isoform X1 n=1 Tax=Drosophila sechellia TaxID=7238 RepID=UPI0013DDF9F2|nr:protein phosphatase 1 regulatory subunit 12B-like isoform X1 [Drosophila sechellia]
MSSLDARNNSAMMKRAEQLKRWEESDTNRAAPTPRHEHGRRIKFSSGCVFLAACLSGDKDEVVQLLDQGADINTANVDGLTALHQTPSFAPCRINFTFTYVRMCLQRFGPSIHEH